MAYPFQLPTTGSLSFSNCFVSTSFPSLPLTATSHRALLRDTLKRHKRLSPREQSSNLTSLIDIIDQYLPYLHALQSQPSSDLTPQGLPFQCEWRSTLSKRPVGVREQPRVKLSALQQEVRFVTTTLAYVHTLRARSYINAVLYNSALPDGIGLGSVSDHATTLLNQATVQLLLAASIYTALLQTSTTSAQIATTPVDIVPEVFKALINLSMASASLVGILKLDPYPSQIALEHDKDSKEWMYKSPTVPTGVRALVLSRMCVEASDLAGKALASLNLPGVVEKIDPQLKLYCENLHKVGRAKACRFLGVDAEAQGNIGEGIGWVRTGREILGLADITGGDSGEGSKIGRGLERLKRAREESKEKKLDKAKEAGNTDDDAGRLEEGRVLAALEKKWVKTNDKLTFQLVKSSSDLLSQIPSGRPVHPDPNPWKAPKLSPEIWSSLRAHIEIEDESHLHQTANDGNSSEEEALTPSAGAAGVPGAFPTSRGGYY